MFAIIIAWLWSLVGFRKLEAGEQIVLRHRPGNDDFTEALNGVVPVQPFWLSGQLLTEYDDVEAFDRLREEVLKRGSDQWLYGPAVCDMRVRLCGRRLGSGATHEEYLFTLLEDRWVSWK